MNSKRRLWIIVAGPYRSGAHSQSEFRENLDRLNQAALAIFRKGHVPIIGVNLALPLIRLEGDRSYDEIMMPLSLAAADRCDAVLRIGGASSGADMEVERVQKQGGLVFSEEGEIPDISEVE